MSHENFKLSTDVAKIYKAGEIKSTVPLYHRVAAIRAGPLLPRFIDFVYINCGWCGG